MIPFLIMDGPWKRQPVGFSGVFHPCFASVVSSCDSLENPADTNLKP